MSERAVHSIGHHYGGQTVLEQLHGVPVPVSAIKWGRIWNEIDQFSTILYLINRSFRKMYNWWRQRKHRAMTKDESHQHMAWEQDYHLQDPGRMALFDEYLEMSELLLLSITVTTICAFLECPPGSNDDREALLNDAIPPFTINCSYPVWVCDPICGRIPSGAFLCADK